MSEVLTPQTVETKSGVGSKGKPWTIYRWSFSEGAKAGTFDKKTSDFLSQNIGKPVNVEIVQTEKGKDLAGAWPIDGEQPTLYRPKISIEKKSGDDYMRPRNPGESRLIARQACLHAATRLLAGTGVTDGAALATADRFVEWVFQEDVGVRHIKADHTATDVAVEREAVLNDKPANQVTKDVVIGLLGSASTDAKAVLHSYGLKTVGDIQGKLTEHAAKLFIEASNQIPL
ncbi:MAG: hypothetical protein NUW01_00520 [Gemmatimonadaceae bacterium]|nr:hypothetical protein [Gemmatimonadaceae bacterium]